ncbi:hypothetical protein CY34DRAFT_807754 [Suillus luteus UH-Slu-Lm8-n1]|uniref:Uncharacterized protein n=1 Tax=Suillus luteus UH-Slu-Lm8-n1 TaxID=930992 RepID=A0A0D0AZW4_9AGAM|nr:hypothetical protein CY34DRAFT_807754 [Suillus luteus UH-Slu-Lm8-n1]
MPVRSHQGTNAPAAADITCMLQITRDDSGVEKKRRRVQPKKPMFAPRTYYCPFRVLARV